jgi:hypothetical protein
MTISRCAGLEEGVMLLPFRHRPTPPKPLSKTLAAEATSSPPDPAEPGPQHLDYDLQPLHVEGLSHYIEPVVDDERFRVH